MSKINNSVIKINGKTLNTSTVSGTITNIVPSPTSGSFTLGPGTHQLNGTVTATDFSITDGTSFAPMHISQIWSVGSRKKSASNVSDNPSLSDKQWMTLLRKHIQLYVTDNELTDFLMEDALKEK
jgi:hypothetical protein